MADNINTIIKEYLASSSSGGMLKGSEKITQIVRGKQGVFHLDFVDSLLEEQEGEDLTDEQKKIISDACSDVPPDILKILSELEIAEVEEESGGDSKSEGPVGASVPSASSTDAAGTSTAATASDAAAEEAAADSPADDTDEALAAMSAKPGTISIVDGAVVGYTVGPDDVAPEPTAAAPTEKTAMGITSDQLKDATQPDLRQIPLCEFYPDPIDKNSFYFAVPFDGSAESLAQQFNVTSTNFIPTGFINPSGECNTPFEEVLEAGKWSARFKALVFMLEFYNRPNLNQLEQFKYSASTTVKEHLITTMLVGNRIPDESAEEEGTKFRDLDSVFEYKDYYVAFGPAYDIVVVYYIKDMRSTLNKFLPSTLAVTGSPRLPTSDVITLLYSGESPSSKIKFTKQFGSAAGVISNYAIRLEQAQGNTKVNGDVDLRKESRELRKTAKKVLKYIEKQNNFDSDKNYLISMERADGGKLVSISGWNQELGKSEFDEGITSFSGDLNDRTLNYMANLEQISRVNQGTTTWTDFINTYVSPNGGINPSAPVQSPDGSLFTNEAVNALDRKFGNEVRNFRSCAAATFGSFRDFKDSFTPEAGITREEKRAARKLRRKARRAGFADKLKGDWKDFSNEFQDRFGKSRKESILEEFRTIVNLNQVFINFFDRISLAAVFDAILACIPGFDFNIGCQPLVLPKFPGFQLPTIPTVDIMADLGPLLLKSLIDALTQALIDAIGSILQNLFDVCGVDYEIDTTLRGTEGSKLQSLIDDVRERDLYELMRFLCGYDEEKINEQNRGTYIDQVRKMMQDVSAVLAATEICSLFQGSASDRDLTNIREIIRNRYDLLFECMPGKAQISTFFSKMGLLIDSSYCREVANSVPNVNVPLVSADTTTSSAADAVSVAPDSAEAFANQVLADSIAEDTCLDAQAVDDMVAAGNRRRDLTMDRLKNIGKMIKSMSDGDAGTMDLMYLLEEDISCADGNDNVAEALQKKYHKLAHPALDTVLDTYITSVITPIRESEYADAKELWQYYCYDKKVENEVCVYHLPGGGAEPVLTADIRRLRSQGAPVDEQIEKVKKLIDDGKIAGIEFVTDERNIYKYEDSMPQAAPGLKTALKSLETSNASKVEELSALIEENNTPKKSLQKKTFFFDSDEESIYYQLRVQNDPTAMAALADFYANFMETLNNKDIGIVGGLQDDPTAPAGTNTSTVEDDPTGFDNLIIQLSNPEIVLNNIPKWKIRYKMPIPEFENANTRI
jgi:hypothetical protein